MLWLIGDDILQRAYGELVTNYDWLKYLAKFKFLETWLSHMMTMPQAIWALVDLLAANKYIPSAVVLHVSVSDFRMVPNHLIGHMATQMLSTCRYLLRRAQPFPHAHIGVFTSQMLPMQWYMGWGSQQQACCSRLRFNGALARAAASTGYYIVPHPELSPQDYPAFISTGTQHLSPVGNLIFLADIQAAIHKQDPPVLTTQAVFTTSGAESEHVLTTSSYLIETYIVMGE